MGYSTGQKELPSTPGRSKVVKKSRTRKMRRESKKNLEENPIFNKFKGYA